MEEESDFRENPPDFDPSFVQRADLRPLISRARHQLDLLVMRGKVVGDLESGKKEDEKTNHEGEQVWRMGTVNLKQLKQIFEEESEEYSQLLLSLMPYPLLWSVAGHEGVRDLVTQEVVSSSLLNATFHCLNSWISQSDFVPLSSIFLPPSPLLPSVALSPPPSHPLFLNPDLLSPSPPETQPPFPPIHPTSLHLIHSPFNIEGKLSKGYCHLQLDSSLSSHPSFKRRNLFPVFIPGSFSIVPSLSQFLLHLDVFTSGSLSIPKNFFFQFLKEFYFQVYFEESTGMELHWVGVVSFLLFFLSPLFFRKWQNCGWKNSSSLNPSHFHWSSKRKF